MLLPNKYGIGMIHLHEVCVCKHLLTLDVWMGLTAVSHHSSCHYCQHILGQWKEICAVWRWQQWGLSLLLLLLHSFPALPGVCQSTIVLVATMGYCVVIATNTLEQNG